MILRTGVGASARLPALLGIVGLVPLIGLGWLASRLLDQDRELETQRQATQLANAATLLTQELDRALGTWESRLPALAAGAPLDLPSGVVVAVVGPEGLVAHYGVPVQHWPRVAGARRLAADPFAGAEAVEIRERRPAEAAEMYRRLSSATDPEVRAGALVRLARCLLAERRYSDALAAYDALAQLGNVPVAGFVAELVARQQRVAVMDLMGDQAGRAREVAMLRAGLRQGRFSIDRASYDTFQMLAPSVADEPGGDTPAAGVLAGVIANLWPSWTGRPSGRAAWSGSGRAFVSVWQPVGVGTAAMIQPLDDAMVPIAALAKNLTVRAGLTDLEGRGLWGDANPDAGTTRPTTELGVPMTWRVSLADPSAAADILATRRNVTIAVFVTMAAVIAAAVFFVARAIRREVGVAQLQSDFLAAVSHEFRTPLAAMSHLTDVLEEQRGQPDRLPAYYAALARETRRLHGLVESLLDFGRTEAGRRVYSREPCDLVALSTATVADARDRLQLPPPRIDLRVQSDTCSVLGDREALALVVRNLLDNALKYSPDDSPVRVEVSAGSTGVSVTVADAGPGIEKAEQRTIFRKFVRGAAAREGGVKGTGIGLTMAMHVVRAHGGHLLLASEPGKGSRFTVTLPRWTAAAAGSVITDHP